MPSDIGPLRSVALAHARDAFGNQARIDAQWQELGYPERCLEMGPLREYDAFAELLARLGSEALYLPPEASDTLDALYPRDAAVMTDAGMILGSMGKAARRNEPERHRRFYDAQGVPVLGAIDGAGRLEGGDVAWLAPRLPAVGNGYRTNADGIRQLTAFLGDLTDEIIEVALPHYRGPGDVFHLMSIISPVAADLAVVYSPLMPVAFRNRLLDEGFRLVEVPDEEFDSLGCNVLAVAPGVCVMVEGNPVTERRLIDAGATVHTFEGDEICRKGCGGPTCLTRPLPKGQGKL